MDLVSEAEGGRLSVMELLACVQREIGFRARVYPRWVEAGKMKADVARVEMERMRGVRAALVRGSALEVVVESLRQAQGSSEAAVRTMIALAVEAEEHRLLVDPRTRT